jgi:DNA helicase-4
MGLLSKIFGFKRTSTQPNEVIGANYTEEYRGILKFNQRLQSLLKEDKFISRKDYKALIEDYAHLIPFVDALKKSQMLESYVKANNLDLDKINTFVDQYTQLANIKNTVTIIKNHNDTFVQRHLKEDKKYLDNILKECDPGIMLDNEQREVVLSNEDHTLVIAGAGAGKTTTVAAKVRYLVEKQEVKPEQILVISFTNKAVNELKERINHYLNIQCPISTFHSIGNSIMNMTEEKKKRIVDSGYMFNIINRYLKANVLNNSELVDKLILFFGSYFTAPYEGNNLAEYFQFISKAEFSTIKSCVQEYIKQVTDHKTKEVKSLNNEILRSQEEVNIANFLYLHQIDYEYEPFYQYQILDSNKPYTPDFVIRQGDKTTYIEHFGINQDGTNNLYSPTELDKYKKRINDKILLHRAHKTDLIYTFSKYNDGTDYLAHLKEELIARGYELNKRPSEDVYKKIVNSEESKYIVGLVKLLCNFISNFKTQGYREEHFDIFKSKIQNVRTRLFLDICRTCYLEYQKCLIQDNCTDFEDMINESAEIIRKKQILKEQLDYKYIIVDEYQDISRQRYNLIKELSTLCNAKIVAVGDDWQSIYAFSGSILPLFTHFCDEFGYGQELKITRTYRNAQELINIAGAFVQRNTEQIQKRLISHKHIENPVIIRTYKDKKGQHKIDEPKGGVYHYLGESVNDSIQEILDENAKENKRGVASILIIGRYGFDARNMCNSSDFNYDEKSKTIYSVKFGRRVKLSFLTAHSSKGLSADNVIIINAKDDLFGFPSQIEDDPVLKLVVNNDDSYNYAEERRLFYVALTRTKNRVFIITPENRPSEFIKELLSEKGMYPNVNLKGQIRLHNTRKVKDLCPICGYPMQRRMNKNYGLELWMCTNDQEICGFMTNDRRGTDMAIKKCDWCKDGYLIVKAGNKNGEYILGCTNYKADKTGCNRMMNRDYYHNWKQDGIGAQDQSWDKFEYNSKEIKHTPPKMTDTKKPSVKKERKKRNVNTTTTTLEQIEKEGFNVVCDNYGNVLTDLVLLKKIRNWRINKAREEGKRAYIIMHNTTLVDLATRRPTTLEELHTITGLGDRKIDSFGDEIIKIIDEHITSEPMSDIKEWDAEWPDFS